MIKLQGFISLTIILLVTHPQQLQAKDTVDVNVIPKAEFYFDQQQIGNENSFSFQLNQIKDFYSMNLQKLSTESSKDAKNNQTSTNQQNNSSSISSSILQNNNIDVDPEQSECNLSIEGGDFEPVENFEIYQNINSNVLQISRSDNEYYYFYLDTQLQFYTYRVNTKKETLKYLGHKKIEFEDLTFNTTDPNNPLINVNNSKNVQNPNSRLRRNLQFQEGLYNDSKIEDIQSEQQKIYKIAENGEVFNRKLGEEKEEQKGGQPITYLKLIQWKDQIICVLNTYLFVIVQDKAYKIMKIDHLLDVDAIEDFLFVAMGLEGLKVFEFQQGLGGSQQPIKDIQLKKIAILNWKEQYVRLVQVVKDRIFFVNKESIYIYLLQGKSISFGCMINDTEIPIDRSIEKLHSYENSLVVLTQMKTPEDKAIDKSKKLKGYIEFQLNKDSLSTNFSNGSGQSNGNFEGNGYCFYKVKEENDLPNGVRDIQIDEKFILFGIENGIHGVKLGVKQQYLNENTRNKWINNFIPNVSHFKKIEESSYVIVATGNKFSLFNFQDFTLTLTCDSDKLFDKGNLITFNGNKTVHTNAIDYQIIYVTNQCAEELGRQKGEITRDQIDFHTFKSYFGYGIDVKYEDIHYLNTKDNQTCIIQQTIGLKQTPTSFAKNHGFIIGMTCAVTGGAVIFFLVNHFLKNKKKGAKDTKTPEKKKKRTTNINQSSKTSDESGIFNANSSQKSSAQEFSKKESLNNNSSTCILSQTKSTKNQSSVFEDESQHNQSSNNDYSYNQNYFSKSKKEEKQSSQNNLQMQQQQLIEQTQQMLYLSQQEQQQFIQQILQNPQFQQLSKYEQDRFLQHQYQQHLEYQRQIRLQQMKQQQLLNQQMQNQKGGKNKIISPIQKKYGGGVEAILETDSDKKMSTRRDQEAFYRMKKRNNKFEENLIRSYQKNINVINDLNLNIQLEENIQPPSHNVFSPQNFGKVQLDIDHEQPDVDEVLTANQHKQQSDVEGGQKQHLGESIPTDASQIQNPQIPFMTLQSIQNSLKQINQQQQTKNKLSKKPKLIQQSKQYQEYEDESDEEEENEQHFIEEKSINNNSKQQFQQHEDESPQKKNQLSTNMNENESLVNLKQQNSQKSSNDKEKNSLELELKTSESQNISDKMTRSNNDTTSTSTASNRQLNAANKDLKNVQQVKANQLTTNKVEYQENEVEEADDMYHNTLNDNESNQDEAQLNHNPKSSESQ